MEGSEKEKRISLARVDGNYVTVNDEGILFMTAPAG